MDDGRPIDQFTPVACPGARLPHGWIRIAGERASSLDLVRCDAFTLIAGKDGDRWINSELARGSAVKAVRAGLDFVDEPGPWCELVGLGCRSAILVRPDGHILAMASDDTPGSIARLRGELNDYLGAEAHAASAPSSAAGKIP